jgi:hypothetical protein
MAAKGLKKLALRSSTSLLRALKIKVGTKRPALGMRTPNSSDFADILRKKIGPTNLVQITLDHSLWEVIQTVTTFFFFYGTDVILA